MTVSANKPLHVDLRREGRVLVIAISGSADMFDAPKLRDALRQFLARSETAILLDLTNLDFLGPGGLDAILSARQELPAPRGRIGLVNPHPEIRRMLEVTRLTRIFPIYDSVERACEALDRGE